MLRFQIIQKINYERQMLNDLLEPMAKKNIIKLSWNVRNALSTEVSALPRWLRNGYIDYTSRSRYSFIYDEKLADQRYFRLNFEMNYIKKALRENHQKSYGYFVTVNPLKLRYKETTALNRKIIHDLRKHSSIAAIYKAIENTYIHAANNIHFHYLILSSKSLNKRKIARKLARDGRRFTNSTTSVDVERVTDWKRAESYITKQTRLPLPLKHPVINGKRSRLNQFQMFRRYPHKIQIRLLGNDINNAKGMQRQRLYIGTNSVAKACWKRFRTIKKHRQQQQNKKRAILKFHDWLIRDGKNYYLNQAKQIISNLIAKEDRERHQKAQKRAVIAAKRYRGYLLEHKNNHVRKQKHGHHTSNNEAMSRLYLGTYYGWTREPIHTQQLSFI